MGNKQTYFIDIKIGDTFRDRDGARTFLKRDEDHAVCPKCGDVYAWSVYGKVRR